MGFADILLILGMHRSGTSLVAEILRENGVSTGRRVVAESAFNTGGHHEDRFLVWINKKILRRFKGTWSSPPALPDHWLEDGRVLRLMDQVRDYRRRVIDTHERFFFKDPRTCLTLPFWSKALGDPLRCVVVLRRPEEVVRSLLRRNRAWRRPAAMGWRAARCCYHTILGAYEPVEPLDAAKAWELWRLYNEKLLEHVDHLKAHVIVYEQLLRDPEGEVARLMAFAAPERTALQWDMVKPRKDARHSEDGDLEVRKLLARYTAEGGLS